MSRTFRSRGLQLAGVIVFLGLVLAACSNNSSGGLYGGSGGSPAASAQGSGSVAVSSTSISGLGTAIAAPNGLTLYMLTADQGGKPTCVSGSCIATWPPLMASSTPTAGAGVKANLLGTVATPSGGMQVTYSGWPVYTYVGDSNPGTASGESIQSFGGTWYAIGSSGKPLGATASGSTSGSSSGGSGW